MDFAKLKNKAKKSLEGNWKDALIVIIIFGLCGAISVPTMGANPDKAATSTALLSLLSFIITCLLGFGYLSYFLKLSRDKEVNWKEIFSKTNLAVDYFVIALIEGVFVFLWSLLFIIPGIIAAIRYSQAFLIKLDDPDLSATECIDKSKEMMNGHKLDYFLLILSFIGWFILGVFTCGILYLWLIPYYSTTICNFYNEIKK